MNSLLSLQVVLLVLLVAPTLGVIITAGEDPQMSETKKPESEQSVLGIPVVPQPGARPRDCEDLQRASPSPLSSGIYDIQPRGFETPFQVFCDFETTGGGWTIIQRRIDGSANFQRNWADYKNGFGKLDREFWLGNNKIAKLTAQKKYRLRIELTGKTQAPYYAEYSYFRTGDAATYYQLFLGAYSGNAGRDSLEHHRGRYFSAQGTDHDNDDNRDCAAEHGGGWWFGSCDNSNLNGVWGLENEKGIEWIGLPGGNLALRFTEMKIRAA